MLSVDRRYRASYYRSTMIGQNVVKRSTRLHTAAEVCVMLVVDWIVSSSTHSEYQEALMSQRGRACFVSVSS